MENEVQDEWITASEVATYIVCPESWRLKRIHMLRKKSGEPEKASTKIRSEWLAEQNFSAQLRSYAKIVYLLLVLVVITIFLLDQNKSFLHKPSDRRPVTIQHHR